MTHPTPLERDTNAPIARACRTCAPHGRLIRVHTTVRIASKVRKLSDDGTPDRIWLPGRGMVIFLEQKRPGGALSPAQIAWHEWAKGEGYAVATVESGADVVRVWNEVRA